MALDLTPEQLLPAIKGSNGVVSAVSRRLGIDWHSAKKFIEKYEETSQAFKNERESLLDKCEVTLMKLLASEDGNVAMRSAQFYLERLGRDRGFSPKSEIELSGEFAPKLIFDLPDPRCVERIATEAEAVASPAPYAVEDVERVDAEQITETKQEGGQ